MSKSGNNAFMAFMKFYRQREAKKGVRFDSFEQIVQPAGEEWQQMSAEQKNYYRQYAKNRRAAPAPYNNNSSSHEIAAEKCGSTKNNLPNYDTQHSKAKMETKTYNIIQYSSPIDPQRTEMKKNVERKLTWHLMENFDVKILEKAFYILCVESYEIAGKKEFPAEIAFVKFSLKEGVIATKSFTLQPIEMPANMVNDTIKSAMNSHKIDPLNAARATNRYRYVAEQIKSLCDSNDPCDFIFTLYNDFNEVQRAVSAIRRKINSRLFAPAERISCAEDLYEILLRFKDLGMSPHDLIRFNSIGKNCQWDAEVSLCCSYHHLYRTRHCALAKARKITYLLHYLLQEPYQLTLTNKHLPGNIGDKDFDTPELEAEIAQFDEEENLKKLADEEKRKARQYGGRFAARLKPTPSPLLAATNFDVNNNFQEFDVDENDSFSYTRMTNGRATSSTTSDERCRNDFSSRSRRNIPTENLIDFAGGDFTSSNLASADISTLSLNANSDLNYTVDENVPICRLDDLSIEENNTAPERAKIAPTSSIDKNDNPFLKTPVPFNPYSRKPKTKSSLLR